MAQAQLVYAHIHEETVKNTIVCDNYEEANKLARMIYDDTAIAVEINQWLVSIGSKYMDGMFYNVNEETGEISAAEYIPTQEQQVAVLEAYVSEIKEELNPTIDAETCTLDELITYTVQQFGNICTSIIYAGSDVETEKGIKHFSYEMTDQTNLKAAYDLAIATKLDIPYHADGEDCCLWSPADIILIYATNELLKTYQTTYCNLLNGLIRAADSKEVILEMNYGDDLPEGKQAELDATMQQANLVFRALVSSLQK